MSIPPRLDARAERPSSARRAPSPRFSVRRALAATAVAIVATSVPSAFADGGSVAIGEVSTIVGHADVVPTIKATLTTELSKVKPAPGRSFVVNANLVKLETIKGSARKQAIVSLALRDADGNLKGTVQGTASGDRVSDRDLVEAATKGGSKAVAEYVAK